MDRTTTTNRSLLWWVAGIIALVALLGLYMSSVADNDISGRASAPNTESTVSPGTPAVPNTGAPNTDRD